MIAKVKSTAHFGGHYLERGEAQRDERGNLRKDESGRSIYAEKENRVRFQFAVNMAADPADRHAVRKEMEATAALNKRAKNVYHKASLSLHPDEHRSAEEWRQIASDYLERVENRDGENLAGRKAWIVGHKDEEHEHIHIVACRIDDNGKCWNDYDDWGHAENAAREIEHTHGLRRVQGTKGRYAEGKAPTDDPRQKQNGPPERGDAITDGAYRRQERTGQASFEVRVKAQRSEIREHLRASTSFDDASERLASYGMELRERKRGYVLTDKGAEKGTNEAQASSSIDRDSSAPKLKARWQREQQQRQGRDHGTGKRAERTAQKKRGRTGGYGR